MGNSGGGGNHVLKKLKFLIKLKFLRSQYVIPYWDMPPRLTCVQLCPPHYPNSQLPVSVPGMVTEQQILIVMSWPHSISP